MELTLTPFNGGESKNVALSSEVFEKDFNETLIHQAVTTYLAGARQGTKGQKSRSDVSGGGAKPWKQKGTGRARSGTIRSPIWRGGGKTFAATNRDFTKKINKKMYRVAMRSILSELVRQDRLVVVDVLDVEAPKTKMLNAQLQKHNITNALLVNSEVSENLYLSSRNLQNIAVCTAKAINPVDLIGYEKVVITESAIKEIEGMLA